MKVLGFDITVARVKQKALSSLRSAVGSWQTIFDWTPGAWQADSPATFDYNTAASNWAFFSCVTLIADYIANLRPRVMQYVPALKIFEPTQLRPVLQEPNPFQTRIEFFRCWVLSLLFRGNTYVLKQRDERGFVVGLFILDACKVTPLIDEEGGVWYQLGEDNLSDIKQTVIAPASEIIHDRINTLWHPLIGVSPIYAAGIAAMQSSAIQKNSQKFFENFSRPSGILTAPGPIATETATRLKTTWAENYGGANIGKVAVLGDGLKYEAMAITAIDSQLIEQLKFSGEVICATLKVPPYKLGLGQMPTVNNTSALNQQFYQQALQPIVENMELKLDKGLELNPIFETWFDTKPLERMDSATRLDSHSKAIAGGWLAPNEARREEDRPPVPGGESPFLQQQNYSLSALAKRDAKEDPFAKDTAPKPESTATPSAAGEPSDEDLEAQEQALTALLTKELAA